MWREIWKILQNFLGTKALFSSLQKQKTFQDSSSHRILRHMHGALNIYENKN